MSASAHWGYQVEELTTYSKPRGRGCAVEDERPPGVEHIGTQIHTGEDHASVHWVLISHGVVAPGKKGRLAGIDRSGPVVRAKHGRCRGCARRIFRGRQDERREEPLPG